MTCDCARRVGHQAYDTQGLQPAARERLLLLALSSLETTVKAQPGTTNARAVLADTAIATCNAWHGSLLGDLGAEGLREEDSNVLGTCWQAAADKLQLYESTALTGRVEAFGGGEAQPALPPRVRQLARIAPIPRWDDVDGMVCTHN